jgi:ABC-type branched-subunit amino acid transport system substrate-binding protein
MTFRRTFRCLAAVMALATFAAACGGDDDASSATTAAADETDAPTAPTEAAVTTAAADGPATTGKQSADPEEIRVLVSAPLTGDSAEFGVALQRGAELAAKQINDAGGIAGGPHQGARIKIESADDQLDTDAAATIASQYVDDKGIWLLTGFWTSGQAQVAGQVADRANLSVCTASGASFLTTDNDNIFTTSPPFESMTAALIDYVKNDMKATKVALIRTDFSYIDDLEKGLKSEAAKQGVEIVSEQTYQYGSTQDFSTYLTTAAAADPDVILDASLQTEKGQMFRQAHELGIDIPIVDWAMEGPAETFLGIAGDLAVGAVQMQTGPILGAGNPSSVAMQQAWKDEYGETMRTAGGYTYQCILYLAKALEDGAESREDLNDAFAAVSGGEGPWGPLGFTDRRQTKVLYIVTKFTGTTFEDQQIMAQYLLETPSGFERL